MELKEQTYVSTVRNLVTFRVNAFTHLAESSLMKKKGNVGRENKSIPGNIVAYETEPRYSRVILHNAAQRSLCILRHRVGLVKDNNLVWRARICLSIGRNCLCAGGLPCKVFDLFAHDRNTALVRCIQFKHTRPKVVRSTKTYTLENEEYGTD